MVSLSKRIFFLSLIVVFFASILVGYRYLNRDFKNINNPSSAVDRTISNVNQSRGVYALIEWEKSPQETTWQKGFVDGVVLRTYWRDLNPQRDVYNWEFLEDQFKKAQFYKKRIALVIAPGFYSPDYVFQDEKVEKSFFQVPQGPFKGETKALPLPWDKKYLDYWFEFLAALAHRFKDRSEFTYIAATGPNSHNGEVSLPRETEDEKVWLRLVGGESRELEDRLFNSWTQTIDNFCKDFEGKSFTLALISKSLPLGGDPILEEAYNQKLAKMGDTRCPKYFGLQTNGLDARPLNPKGAEPLSQWEIVKSYSGRILTGFQTRAPSNLYKCDRRNKESGDECSPSNKEILRQTIVVNGLERNPDFLQIYESDILNGSLEPILLEAHQKLTGQT